MRGVPWSACPEPAANSAGTSVPEEVPGGGRPNEILLAGRAGGLAAAPNIDTCGGGAGEYWKVGGRCLAGAAAGGGAEGVTRGAAAEGNPKLTGAGPEGTAGGNPKLIGAGAEGAAGGGAAGGNPKLMAGVGCAALPAAMQTSLCEPCLESW